VKKHKRAKEKTEFRIDKEHKDLLATLGVEEFFLEGDVSIERKTCRGTECQLCIKACPTSALFWKVGEVGIVKELCIYCGACVLSCIVDDCIRIERKRVSGEVETFSKPKDYIMLQNRISTEKRSGKIKEAFPKTESFLYVGNEQPKQRGNLRLATFPAETWVCPKNPLDR
jgi:Fe-S-cluster-containing hydrogenase component 2